MVLRIAAAFSVLVGIVLVASFVTIPQLSVFGPDSMQVGDIEEFSVSSVNFGDPPSTWSNDPCYGSGVDLSADPSIAIRENSLSVQGTGDWRHVGGVVGYEFPITVRGEEPDDFVTIEYTVYCEDGSSDIQAKFVSVSEVPTDDGDDGTFTPQNPDIRQYKPPNVDVSGDTVTGTVHLENVGGDMVSFNIVEMQVRGKDQPVLSVVRSQDTCDPSHPENVHKEFALDADERVSISLKAGGVSSGEHNIHFITATGCGGEWVNPYDSYEYGNVCVGGSAACMVNEFKKTIAIILLGIIAIIGGGVFLFLG